jgi:hypothetical protein
MSKTISVLGVLVALSLSGIAFFGLPDGAPLMAREEAAQAQNCPQVDVALDEGYGITRTIRRPACDTTGSVR